MKIIKYSDFKQSSFKSPEQKKDLEFKVSEIITKVRKGGDKAILKLTKKFDKVVLQNLRVDSSIIGQKTSQLNNKDLKVFKAAIKNIKLFHSQQLPKTWYKKDLDGTVLGQIISPLDRVGCYIPGGNNAYPSSLLMNVIPSQIAKVPSIAVASPPTKTGIPSDYILGCCGLLGIDEVYAIGGVQAIAAFAYGTATIKNVCKITGPGNQYVAEAKRQVFGKVGIDSIAGPSEIVVLAEKGNSEFIARDLFSQTEHDIDTKAILITPSKELAIEVKQKILTILKSEPKNSISRQSIKKHGKIIVTQNLNQAIDLVNEIAPEHLEVLVDKPQTILSKIRNAGAIFVGQFSCVPVGDYFAGSNHTIPTNSSARYSSPLSANDFLKTSSYINYTASRLKKQSRAIIHFAELEKFPAHANAVKCRFQPKKKKK